MILLLFVGLFDDFKAGMSSLQEKVGEFKKNHTVISGAISEIINSLPGPFDTFGSLLWNGLEQKDESAEKVLNTLQKMAQNDELAFMEITTNIKKSSFKPANAISQIIRFLSHI